MFVRNSTVSAGMTFKLPAGTLSWVVREHDLSVESFSASYSLEHAGYEQLRDEDILSRYFIVWKN